MAYVTVPKDLTKIKSKVMFNLTKRQLLCFGAAVAIGLPLFFLTKDSAGTTTAALCMVLAMLPMFLLAMYEKNGQPLEVIIRQFVEVKFLRPKERPYQTNNFYTALARQERLDKEVREIWIGTFCMTDVGFTGDFLMVRNIITIQNCFIFQPI